MLRYARKAVENPLSTIPVRELHDCIEPGGLIRDASQRIEHPQVPGS